jgi:hypothetical protein
MKATGRYENEVEKPKVASHGHQESGMGCADFKKEAMDIAYGQAGSGGCKSDSGKITSQMKHYDWESPSEY